MTRTAKYVQQKYETIESITRFLKGEEYPKYPANVFLETSNLCDLKCAMCGPFSALNATRMFALKDQERGFMQTPEGLNLEDVFAHALRLQVFGYGEPTLNPDFSDFLKLAGHYETLISFFTNGMHFTDKLCAEIVEAQVREVSVSFSGASKELYENIYQGGVWETVLSGIRRLADRKKEMGSEYPVISINSIAYKHHVRDFEQFIDVMLEAGANVIYLKPLIAVSSVPSLAHHGSIYRDWGPEGEILRRAKEKAHWKIWLNTHLYEGAGAQDMADYERKQAAFYRQFDLDPENLPEEIPVADLKALSKTVKMIKPPRDYVPPEQGVLGYTDPLPAVDLGAGGLYCLEPFHTFYVRRDLEVKPCCNALAPTHLGNVKETRAEDIWTGEGFEETRKQILAGEYPRMCHGCVKGGNAHALHHFADDIEEYAMWYSKVFNSSFESDVPSLEALGGGPEVAARWRSPQSAQAPEPVSADDDGPPPPSKPAWMQHALKRVGGWFDRSHPLPEIKTPA